MSDETPKATATVLSRTIQRLGDKDAGGLPTANSRIDIFKSKVVVIPVLQDAADAVKPTPTFEPVRRRLWLRVRDLLIGAAAAGLALVALWYLFAR